jgi:DNA replication protein DnaC
LSIGDMTWPRREVEGRVYWTPPTCRAFAPPDGTLSLSDLANGAAISKQQAAAARGIWQALRDGKASGAVIIGPPGTGKTVLATGVLDHVKQSTDGLDTFDWAWINWPLFARLTLAGSKWRLSPVLAKLTDLTDVIVDDLPRPRSAEEAELFAQIVMDRYTDKKATNYEPRSPLSLTTNLTHDEIAAGYGDRVASRLCEHAVWVTLGGTSQRQPVRVNATTTKEKA